LIERALRQSMVLSQGDPTIFVTRPISASLIIVSIILLAAPVMVAFFRRKEVRARE
jgi:TctA family transporter